MMQRYNTIKSIPARLRNHLVEPINVQLAGDIVQTINLQSLKVAISLILMLMFASCTNVREYQKNKLNDAEMSLGNRKAEKSESNFQSYREGSSGANSGKTGGGCGCN